jgi:hypothetical protein
MGVRLLAFQSGILPRRPGLGVRRRDLSRHTANSLVPGFRGLRLEDLQVGWHGAAECRRQPAEWIPEQPTDEPPRPV